MWQCRQMHHCPIFVKFAFSTISAVNAKTCTESVTINQKRKEPKPMCAIGGFFDTKGNLIFHRDTYQTILEKMNHAQKHRGPDEDGTYLDNFCGLSHTRLSILDLAKGSQPMHYQTPTEDYWIIYNGEIYNMPTLRRELEQMGLTFQTTCDTEVLLLGYALWGDDIFSKLNGIFAFAIWETHKKQLTLCRDRLGVKPLFFTKKGSALIFGSEIKALFCYDKSLAKVDEEGLCQLFALGPAHTYGKTVYKNIKEVLPGTFLKITKDSITEHTYWKLESMEHTDSLDATIEKTSYLLQSAIQMQMLSDIPICTFLSGGLDSSIVTAVVANRLKEQGKTLSTYSFDFEGNERYFEANSFQPSQDLPYALEMADYLNTDHHVLQCSNEQLYENLTFAMFARDYPCMADVESSLLYFCGEVSKEHRVTLTGECADEIFGGYPWFYRKDMFERNAFPWSYDMDTRTALLKPSLRKHLDLDGYSMAAYETTIAETPVLPGEHPEEKRRRELSYLNLKWFMATLLERMDRTSMYHSLEARVPFADHRIVEYVFNVPWSIKYMGNTEKGLLRNAARGLLPDSILFRKKSPYPKTYHPVYEQLLKEEFLRILNSNSEPVLQFLDKERCFHFLYTPMSYAKPWYGQLMAGPQLLAYFIQINQWLKSYSITI